jgi:tRNA dimethylallyltransferase
MAKPKVVAIVGPTASGKTSLSIGLAKRFHGEVISADSRQVYRGLDIGSGKVTTEEMAEVPHHLLDVVEPMTIYTAADFKRDAENAIASIVTKNHLPVLAGGTFFYLELLRGTMQAAPVEPDLELRAKLETFSDSELFEQLQSKDSARAATIDRENRRRLIRSLEIIATLGHVPEVVPSESPYDWLILGVDISKERLHQNIHTRLHERIEAGMITEVESLVLNGVTHERLEQFGLEYRYISRYLLGQMTKVEMLEVLETKIKQFAKRQLTWLKRDTSIEWYPPENREAIFGRVDDFLRNQKS